MFRDLGGNAIGLPLSVLFSLSNSHLEMPHLRCTCAVDFNSINHATTCTADCCTVGLRLESRRKNGCLYMYSAFAAYGYSKWLSSCKSSREVSGRGTDMGGP
ncbi:hypothetical protein TNCV_4257471 [Trichonephila clavipes]|nr:hypothetical protein TNCV_4257471 [Trichonephila clavipes]